MFGRLKTPLVLINLPVPFSFQRISGIGFPFALQVIFTVLSSLAEITDSSCVIVASGASEFIQISIWRDTVFYLH